MLAVAALGVNRTGSIGIPGRTIEGTMSHERQRRGGWVETLLAIVAWVYTGAILWGVERLRHGFGPYWEVIPNGWFHWVAYMACFSAWWMALLLFVFVVMIPVGLITFTKSERGGERSEWINPGAGLALATLVGGCLWLSRTMMAFHD